MITLKNISSALILKAKLFTILIAALTFYSCNAQKQEVGSNRLNNEFWTWDNFFSDGRMGWSEAFYISSNGRFQHSQSYSGSGYWVHWWSGKYEYNSDNKSISLSIENGNTKDHDGNLITKDCPDSIRILTITDITITINRKPIDNWSTDTINTTTLKREQNINLMMIPDGNFSCEPESITI